MKKYYPVLKWCGGSGKMIDRRVPFTSKYCAKAAANNNAATFFKPKPLNMKITFIVRRR